MLQRAPLKQRLPSIAALKQLRKRKQRIYRAVTATVAAILLALAGWGVYLSQEDNGRPRFEQVAQFQVANIKYTSWGGLAASAQLAYAKEKNVVVPASVTHDGLKYMVSELGFNSFRHDTLLRKAVVLCEADTMNILQGAFKGCNNLKELYLISSKFVGIGSDMWNAPSTRYSTHTTTTMSHSTCLPHNCSYTAAAHGANSSISSLSLSRLAIAHTHY